MAAPAPDPGTIIYMKDWLTLGALILGPAIAVLITLWAEARRQSRRAKMKLFLQLLGERKKVISAPVAAAINTIDVVFADNKEVVRLWHRYYQLLHLPPSEERMHTWLELLTAMAKALNYSNMSQTTLDKYYIPQGHVDEYDLLQKIRKNTLRVLRRSQSFSADRTEAEIDPDD